MANSRLRESRRQRRMNDTLNSAVANSNTRFPQIFPRRVVGNCGPFDVLAGSILPVYFPGLKILDLSRARHYFISVWHGPAQIPSTDCCSAHSWDLQHKAERTNSSALPGCCGLVGEYGNCQKNVIGYLRIRDWGFRAGYRASSRRVCPRSRLLCRSPRPILTGCWRPSAASTEPRWFNMHLAVAAGHAILGVGPLLISRPPPL